MNRKFNAVLGEYEMRTLERWRDLVQHDNKSDKEREELRKLNYILACILSAIEKYGDYEQ